MANDDAFGKRLARITNELPLKATAYDIRTSDVRFLVDSLVLAVGFIHDSSCRCVINLGIPCRKCKVLGSAWP